MRSSSSIFLNQGEHRLASKPKEGECRNEWNLQRARVHKNLRNLFLVYPHDVEPFLALDGWPFRAGNPAARADAAAPGLLGTPSLLACLATIVSDKSEGAPGASYQASIAGYHDRCRLHVLPLGPREHEIRELVQHFELGTRFPALSASWSTTAGAGCGMSAAARRTAPTRSASSARRAAA